MNSRSPSIFLVLTGLFLAIGILAFFPGESQIIRAETDTTEKSMQGDTLPLLAIMVQLEADMNQISAGIWREDYRMIKRGAHGIARHPKIPRRQVKTIRSILGPEEFQAFVRDDRVVHKTSKTLAQVAGQKDFKRVTDLFLKIQKGCISCHEKHRAEIRNSPKW